MERRFSFRRSQSMALCAALLLSGCQEQLMRTPNIYLASQSDPWKDTPAELRTNKVDVIYATDRAVLTESPLAFGFKRSRSLGFGTCSFSIGEDLTFEELRAQSLLANRTRALPMILTNVREEGRYPDTPWFTRDGEDWKWIPENETKSSAIDAALHSLISRALARTPSKRAVIYVHGFNNDFRAAASVSAQLWHYCGREGVPIVYTWPAGSGLNLRSYNYDRESGEFTNFHLKRFVEAVATTAGLERLDIIAHSRGTDVLINALRELHIKYTAAARGDTEATMRELKIGNVILAAPDIDIDVALQRLAAERLDLACRRLTIYTSSTDLAIAISRWLYRSIIRVGTLTLYEPEENQPMLVDMPKIDLIDARVISDFIGHAYFYSNPAASSDVIMLIRYDRNPGEANGRPLTRDKTRYWILTDDYTPTVK